MCKRVEEFMTVCCYPFCFVCNILFSQLQMVCNQIKNTVIMKYPDSEALALGGFFFLRFLNPVIVSPDRFGITKGKHPSSPLLHHSPFLCLSSFESFSRRERTKSRAIGVQGDDGHRQRSAVWGEGGVHDCPERLR